MDTKDKLENTIEKYARIVSENHLNELTIESEELRITIKGHCEPSVVYSTMVAPPSAPVFPQMPPFAMPSMPMPPASYAPPAPAAPLSAASAAPAAPAARSGKVVKSPIIGIFYSSPSPDKPAFIKVGDKVKKGQIICIIESMKLMNELESEFDGTVAEILLKDGDNVEFGTELIVIS